jgi:hypothetical protein
MGEKVLVLVLRRELDEVEVTALRQKYPGKELEFKTIHPSDYREHATICEQMKPDVVLLPKDRPIPSLAMERGVPHVALLPNGELSELLPFVPQFKPFVPKG